MAKQLPCCARLQTTLIRDKAALSQAARKANRLADRGLSTAKAQAEIAKIRQAISETEASIVQHESEHAGEIYVPRNEISDRFTPR